MKLQQELDHQSKGDVIAVERRYFGASHAELGGVLLSLWGFSDTIVEAVLYHHHPSEGGPHCADSVGPVGIVHAAQFLAEMKLADDPADESRRPALDLDYLTRIGAVESLDKWAKEAAKG